MQKQSRPQPRERKRPSGAVPWEGWSHGARKVHPAGIDVRGLLRKVSLRFAHPCPGEFPSGDVRGRISHIVRNSMLFAYFYYICNCPVGTGLNSDEYEK